MSWPEKTNTRQSREGYRRRKKILDHTKLLQGVLLGLGILQTLPGTLPPLPWVPKCMLPVLGSDGRWHTPDT